MNIKSELVPPSEPLVRISMELTQERAECLADVINGSITWAETPAEDELSALYAALTSPISAGE